MDFCCHVSAWRVDPARLKRIEHAPVPSVVHGRLLVLLSELRGFFFSTNACFFLLILYLLGCRELHGHSPGSLWNSGGEADIYESPLANGRQTCAFLPICCRITSQKFSPPHFRREHWWHTFYSRLYIPPTPTLTLPSRRFARSRRPRPSPSPLSRRSSCDGKFESVNWELTFEPVHW